MYVYLHHQDPEDNEFLPAGESPEALPRCAPLPRSQHELPEKQESPKLRPELTSEQSSPNDPAAAEKARQIQNLEREINALKNNKKGN